MSTTVLSVESLRTQLDIGQGIVRAVDGVGFELRAGECFALVGESGCGKSMTALSIMRLLPEAARITDGVVRLDGTDLLRLPEVAMRAIRGRRVAMIFQEPSTCLNPVLTIGRQICEAIECHSGVTRRQARLRAVELLEAVGIPDGPRRMLEYPFQLSGGLKQRVMIAAALAMNPEILIADEATTALDVTIQAQILDLLRELQHTRGMAILLITHDLGVVASLAQRVAVMYAGEVVEVADGDAFFRAPQHPYSRKLFDAMPTSGKRRDALAVIPGQVPPLTREFEGCRFAERCAIAFERCRVERPELNPVRPGHAVRCWARESNPAGDYERGGPSQDSSTALAVTASVLSVRELRVHFPIRSGVFRRRVGAVKAVDGVSLEIREGRTLALVGESGCGKTTVGKAILRLIEPSAGNVLFRDGDSAVEVDLASLSRERMRTTRAAMQIIFQDPYASLDPRMRISEILLEGMQSLGVGRDDVERQRRLNDLLTQVGLPAESALRYPHEFSGGQRQRIAIARAIAVNPRMIVCDEPTSALDVSVQAQVLNLLKSLQEQFGIAYLFVTHNLAIVEYLAHEVAVMYLGRIVEHGPVAGILRDPKHPYTQSLLAAVPDVDGHRETARLAGEPPSPANPPEGCHFHTRCPQAAPQCRKEYPAARTLSDGRRVSCVLYHDGN